MQGGRLFRLLKLWGAPLFLIGVVVAFRHVTLPFVLAIFIVYLLSPAVKRMEQLRVGRFSAPRWACVVAIYIVFFGVISLFVSAALPRLAGDFRRLVRDAPMLVERMQRSALPRLEAWLSQFTSESSRGGDEPAVIAAAPAPSAGSSVSSKVPSASAPPLAATAGAPAGPPAPGLTFKPLPGGNFRVEMGSSDLLEVREVGRGRFIIGPAASTMVPVKPKSLVSRSVREAMSHAGATINAYAGAVLKLGQTVLKVTVSSILTFFLILMIAAFILIDLERILGFIRSLVPPGFRTEYDVVLAQIDEGMAGVIRGQVGICLCNGVLTYLGLAIFNVKYSLLLALFAGLMSFVPIFGSIMSSVPIVLIALLTGGPSVSLANGIFVLLWIVGIHLLEANFLNPKIIGTAAHIHPVVVVFALIAGERTYGLIGALSAVPVASILQTLFLHFKGQRSRERTAQVSVEVEVAAPVLRSPAAAHGVTRRAEPT
jgi:predicted PurR-regulated permease PerM